MGLAQPAVTNLKLAVTRILVVEDSVKEGTRVDQYLCEAFDELSRSQAKRWIERGASCGTGGFPTTAT